MFFGAKLRAMIAAKVAIGEALPEALVFESIGYNDASHCPMGPKPVKMSAVCAPGTRVVLFGVPGAFTSTCSGRHLPGYLAKVDQFRELGVTSVVCIAVNDSYVMQGNGRAKAPPRFADAHHFAALAWGTDQKVGD